MTNQPVESVNDLFSQANAQSAEQHASEPETFAPAPVQLLLAEKRVDVRLLDLSLNLDKCVVPLIVRQ